MESTNPEKEELSKCCGATKQIMWVSDGGVGDFCSKCKKPWNVSPHQEPVATQHDVECKGCGGVSCKNKVLKGGTVCPSCFDKMTTQEPMEWERAWEKLEVTYTREYQKLPPFTEPLMMDTEQEKVIKQFISEVIKQAEERVRKEIIEKNKPEIAKCNEYLTKKCEHNLIDFNFTGAWGSSVPPPNKKCTKCLMEVRF